jgi:hypothetical protein
MQAVAAYKQRASQRLRPEQLREAVRLLKEVNRRLAGHNLLEASRDELKTAGTQLFADGEPRENSRFLSGELGAFYDAALEAGLILRHPLTGEARLGAAAAEPAGVTRQEAAERAAKLVAGIVEECIQQGFLLSPLAAPLGEASEAPDGFVERLVSGLSGRWQRLARALHPVLAATRVALPGVAVIFALSAAMDGGGPFSSGGGAGMTSGQAVHDLEVAMEITYSQEGSLEGVSSLSDLEERSGMPANRISKVFELERVTSEPPTLYLRHRKDGALVILGAGRRAVIRKGSWQVLE